MRPPSQFGNDITNQSNSNGGNNEDNNNNNNNGGGGNDGNEFPPSIAHMGGTLIFTRQAGRAVIRVVGRCEDAKENGSALGESQEQNWSRDKEQFLNLLCSSAVDVVGFRIRLKNIDDERLRSDQWNYWTDQIWEWISNVEANEYSCPIWKESNYIANYRLQSKWLQRGLKEVVDHGLKSHVDNRLLHIQIWRAFCLLLH